MISSPSDDFQFINYIRSTVCIAHLGIITTYQSIKLDNFGKKITNVALVIADPFYKKIWAGVPPLM